MRSIGYTSRLVSAPGAANSGDMPNVSAPEGHARGIVIDNPSGSWLSVSSLYDLVPPYTLQWSRDLPVGAASVTIRYVDGPAGQVSTQQGDPFTVWLDTDPVGISNGIATPGSAFITQFTPTQSVELPVQFELTGIQAVTSLLPAVAGKRYRIWSAVIRISAIPATAMAKDVPATVIMRASVLTGDYPRITGYLHPVYHPMAPFEFPSGWDFPVGVGVDVGGRTEWGNNERTHIQASATYQLI